MAVVVCRRRVAKRHRQKIWPHFERIVLFSLINALSDGDADTPCWPCLRKKSLSFVTRKGWWEGLEIKWKLGLINCVLSFSFAVANCTDLEYQRLSYSVFLELRNVECWRGECVWRLDTRVHWIDHSMFVLFGKHLLHFHKWMHFSTNISSVVAFRRWRVTWSRRPANTLFSNIFRDWIKGGISENFIFLIYLNNLNLTLNVSLFLEELGNMLSRGLTPFRVVITIHIFFSFVILLVYLWSNGKPNRGFFVKKILHNRLEVSLTFLVDYKR